MSDRRSSRASKRSAARRAADERWMREALALAREGEGLTRPNPPVGAVLVKSRKIVGRGFHKKAGGPHAEVFAIRDAGAAAKGATLYVTLEPCSTIGRTPPCTSAVITAGIKQVVVGCPDPKPPHNGRGLRILRSAGLKVHSGVCREEAEALIEPFVSRVIRGRPFITLKLAMTLDGRIADHKGQSKWITGKEAREHVQMLRRRSDAVLVGSTTVLRDDPSLLPRPRLGRWPYRAVVDRRKRVKRSVKMFSDKHAERSIRYTFETVEEVIEDLDSRGVMHVLCEGGGELAAALVRADLVDEYQLFYAPKLLGGSGTPGFGGAGWKMDGLPELDIRDVRRFGADLLVVARPTVRG